MTIMISLMLISLFSLCHVVVATVLGDLSTVIPDTQLTVLTTVSPNTTSYVGGYYYSFTEQVSGGATLAINNPGQYSASWTSASGKVVAGVGWAPGGNHTIEYEGTFTSDGDTILCVYGWTVSPLVEYYICEAFGTRNPGTGLTHMGTLESDEGTYNVYQTVRTKAWSIVGDGQTFNQFWSIRQSRREGGNITTNNHFVAWKNFGMVIGSYNYQILATESHNSTGTSSVSTTTPTVTHYAQCGGIGWTGGTACVPPWTCQVSNPYFSFCL